MTTFQLKTLQSKLLSKLATTCLLITAGWLTFIGCAPVMDPVAKKAGDGKIADGGTPDPVVDPPDPVVEPPGPVVEPPAPPGTPLVGPIYVAVGNGGKIALSKDSGSSWQAITSGITERLSDIATDGTNIVAVARNGAVVRSTNGGESWSVISSTGSSTISAESAEIEYGNGVFSTLHYATNAFSSGIQYEFYRSTDGGATWAKGTIASGLFTANSASISLAYDGSRFLAVAGFNDEGTIAVSTDGLAYTSGLGNGDVRFDNELLSLRIANGRFFIFNAFSTSFHGFQTPNIYQASTGTWGASPWTTNRSTSATDVTTFPAGASTMSIRDIAHSGSGGVYAFVGYFVNIMTSATAMAGSFTLPTVPTGTGLERIIFFKGKFVAAGSDGIILNGNAAGTTWTDVSPTANDNLHVGEATANKIVFAGVSGAIVVSSDGTTWEAKSATGNTTRYHRLVLIE